MSTGHGLYFWVALVLYLQFPSRQPLCSLKAFLFLIQDPIKDHTLHLVAISL